MGEGALNFRELAFWVLGRSFARGCHLGADLWFFHAGFGFFYPPR